MTGNSSDTRLDASGLPRQDHHEDAQHASSSAWLLLRMVNLSLIAMAIFSTQAFSPELNGLTRAATLGTLAALCLVRVGIRRGWKLMDHGFLLVILASLGVFDDGFHSLHNTWILHLPFALAIRMLLVSRKEQAVWFSLQAGVLLLVNGTSLTPHLDHFLSEDNFPWYFHTNLLTSLVASLLMIGYFQKANERVLEQARADRKSAQAAARSRGEFLSHMSHELRTPLNAMQGFAELAMQDARLPEELQENMRAIRLSADHLTHLVNDILDLAKLESGSLSLQKEGFSPLSCMDEVHTLLRPLATEKGLELRLDAPSIPRILGDRTRCKQILINLVSNAIKYTESGRVEIHSGWKQVGSQIELWVSVRDTGPGIAPEEQSMVFERFHRSSENHSSSGTGLGLSISRSLARAMGGDITLESQQGTGSNFTLRLTSSAVGPQAGNQTRIRQASPRNLLGLRVLLAEDNRTNIRLATQVLNRLEASFDVAEDGGQALELLSRFRYDLVLLDIHMPVLDGFEVAHAIRDPTSAVVRHDTPILALTADAFEDTRRRTIESGMNDLLTKPFRIGELSERILRLVGRMSDVPESMEPR